MVGMVSRRQPVGWCRLLRTAAWPAGSALPLRARASYHAPPAYSSSGRADWRASTTGDTLGRPCLSCPIVAILADAFTGRAGAASRRGSRGAGAARDARHPGRGGGDGRPAAGGGDAARQVPDLRAGTRPHRHQPHADRPPRPGRAGGQGLARHRRRPAARSARKARRGHGAPTAAPWTHGRVLAAARWRPARVALSRPDAHGQGLPPAGRRGAARAGLGRAGTRRRRPGARPRDVAGEDQATTRAS